MIGLTTIPNLSPSGGALIASPSSALREQVLQTLKGRCRPVQQALGGAEALVTLEKCDCEVLFLDRRLPDLDAEELIAIIERRFPGTQVVMLDSDSDAPLASATAGDGGGGTAAWQRHGLGRDGIRREIGRVETGLPAPQRSEPLPGMIGTSEAMGSVYRLVRLVAPRSITVLVAGATGTGKELVARALHASSLRGEMQFVEVNCAAIPEELIESEMFGHRKGSFTGASEDKIGKFQKADGGTLFLDEVGDMSLKTQSKVLRALEEQRVEPVGSNQSTDVDVRIIAATNKKLEDEIGRGAFREDLFYRLNVIPFYVPALRERTEDIPTLASAFLAMFCEEYGKKGKEFSPTAMDVLLTYPWPGNVRELKNLVERLVIVCPSPRIEPHHLPPELFRGASKSPQKPYESLHEARSAYEREFVLRKLEENRWNMTKAAESLGLERSHLYRKLKALGIAPAKP